MRSACLMLLVRSAFVFLIFCAATAFGRIGETTDQFTVRYGAPTDTPGSQITDKSMPLLEGSIHHHYEYQGWRIRAAFIQPDGPAVRMEHSKTPKAGSSVYIQDYEVQAIMAANTPAGMSWKQIPYNNPDSPNKGLAKFVEAISAVPLVKRCGSELMVRFSGYAANSLFESSCRLRANTKRN